MYKVFFIFIFTTFCFSSTINFQEEKFVNALQASVYKNGTIEIKNDSIKVSYKNFDTSYIFFSDYFIVKDKNSEQKLKYEDRVELSIFYKLINLIYRDKKDGIEEFFNLENVENKTVLTPNEYLSNSIEKVEFKKEQSILNFLKIYFKNEDYIKIVQN
ncbi:hypothetical protein [Aliarcobacter butzleri]|uniref:hypothetical protein n=1 Tax=Aliarcobacter butzleri TaxID=28197 RepID=UPI00110BA2C4|nr:hypothetical protein [Aliarcobacter butzleri]